VDPDPHWFWSAGSGSRSKKAKRPTKNRKKGFHVSEVLDVLFRGLTAFPAKLQFLIFKN
jgi:hypothetical protein